ncbi:MAG: hypothetical protein H7138_02555 [Myxococcales bacterium]|nr:hypothetical protein [Myxococcales bacterium]
MPAPDEVVICDQPIPTPVPTPTTDIPEPTTPTRAPVAARCANPPPLYKSVIEFYKFDLRFGGVKVGEHSTTRVKRYRWDWDATAGAYKQPVLDAQTDHSNHHTKNDARLRRYRFTDSRRTDVTGEGFRAYTATANEYCPCQNDVGHLTNRDSCYSFVGLPFSQDHVCHSDTQVQGNAFLTATGKRATYPNECGLGLVHNNAP